MAKTLFALFVLLTTIGCAGPQIKVNPKLNFDPKCPLSTQNLSPEDNAKCLEVARQLCIERGMDENCWATEK